MLKQGKSKKAFEHNVKTEIESGKPQDQSLAIAYEIQRKNKKKMAKGGMVDEDHLMTELPPKDETEHYDAVSDHYNNRKMAEGPEKFEDAYIHESIAKAVMDHMKRKKMAEGGMVDIEANAKEQPNEFYHLNEDEVLKENYDSDMSDMKQPEDSNEHGDEEEKKISSIIRQRMAKKRFFGE